MEKIKGIRQDNTIFKNHHKVADLIYIDEPILSHFKDEKNNSYIYYWCDIDEEHDRWLVVRIDDNYLALYLNGNISLRQVILMPMDKFLYYVDVDEDGNHEHVYRINTNIIPESYLPETDSCYDDDVIVAGIEIPMDKPVPASTDNDMSSELVGMIEETLPDESEKIVVDKTEDDIKPEPDDESAFADFDINLPDTYMQRDKHPVFQALTGLMVGKSEDRALKLLILDTITSKTHILSQTGSPEWPTIDDLNKSLQNNHIKELPRLVGKLHQTGLLEAYGKPYRYGLTPAASTVLAFLNLTFDFQDDSGLASAIVANMNLIQLRKKTKAPLTALLQVFRNILYEINRLNLRLQDALRHRIRVDLERVNADLEIVQAYVEPLRELTDEFSQQAHAQLTNPGRVVAWLSQGRAMLNQFETLAGGMTNYYLGRANRDADGRLAIDNIEAMLAEYAQTEEGWQKIVSWGDKLDTFTGLWNIPIGSLIESYKTYGEPMEKKRAKVAPIVAVNSNQNSMYKWIEDDDAEVEVLADLLQQRGVTNTSNLASPDDWSITVGRVCALDDAIELIKDRTDEEWHILNESGYTVFSDEAEVKRITHVEIGT
ncbi:MAG: hypothetical protein B6242_06045 [Anaerolineaceae bacterium 4572_78]|nr:MAG: hypothetical protein B6242_06045 [Anaerolineaceae bacterium 4572_78]